MCPDNLEKQSFESTLMEFFSSEEVCGKSNLDVLKIIVGDGKELEVHLTHLSSLPVIEQQSPEISKLVSIAFEEDTKHNEAIVAEDKGNNVFLFCLSHNTERRGDESVLLVFTLKYTK